MSQPTALVIGASRGIGKDLVKKLSAVGYDTYGTVRSHPSDSKTLQADLTDEDSLKAAATKIDTLDLLVLNGAIAEDEPYLKLDVQRHAEYYQTNVIGPLSAAAAFLPALRKGKQKTIVFITSLAGNAGMHKSFYAQPAKDRFPLPKGPYSATKAALNMAAVQLYAELEDEGFSVLLVHPGVVESDMGTEMIEKLKDMPPFPFPVISIDESATGIAKVIKSHIDAGKPEVRYYQYSGEEGPL
ncbi:hypothetical protein OC846_004355 [Tilletia horrida]|uniref:NAD(P)-binding protein n=1 Tax=Tilletia horrida TaxID=155126 RepID=A0AAN6JX23_9BASI|nr:hypothetical protein OC845_004407 [Tilletia horrida]KAK0548781.1 hypothetical protein OC846_004355 [Tilletia horrida]KAK0568048.1 hypothetical protein OC861_002364 [Tilletia horrida]